MSHVTETQSENSLLLSTFTAQPSTVISDARKFSNTKNAVSSNLDYISLRQIVAEKIAATVALVAGYLAHYYRAACNADAV